MFRKRMEDVVWPFDGLKRKRRENPTGTLVRYATAIDQHFDDATALSAQRISYLAVVDAMRAIAEAQREGRSKLVVSVRVGIAIGKCRLYAEQYHITVPPYQPN